MRVRQVGCATKVSSCLGQEEEEEENRSDPTAADSDAELFGPSESVMTTSVCVFPSKLKRCN